ncbi:uncharacterized protein LOC143459129 isoform X1 [Clavelina lepadiformis]|uniref:uncharacterized protein LOC143459129 isoform X1 n=1 Tax=Clavelina lepadiformis TaxID=159417 RepID=UPI0040427810
MTSLSKEEYLKRYLSPADEGNKTKKKRKKNDPLKSVRKNKGMKIVDDDVGWNTYAPKDDEFDELASKLLTEDEKPVIADVDVRTEEEKKLDAYRRSNMWKTLGSDEGDKSDVKKRTRHDSDSDLELPRKSVNMGHDDDFRNQDSDLEIPSARTRKRHDSDSDLDIRRSKMSSKNVRHDSDSDISVDRMPVNNKHERKTKLSKKSKSKARHDSDSDLDIERNPSTIKDLNKDKMQSGGRGGLTSVDLLRLEMNKLKKKDLEINQLAQETKDNTTVYRERGSGKKRDLNKERKENEEEAEKRKRKEEQYDKWGKGLKQSAMKADAIADTLHESNKSFTRYNDDEDLEAMRKAAIRDGDPMAAYMARKKQKEKEKGASKEYPKYKGPAPAPNRFKIMPGYRWDGVDRSNGFEKKYFQTLSDNQAYKDEYYKWSVGDM